MRRVFGWSALALGIAAVGLFGIAPPRIESSLNHVTGPTPPPVDARVAALHSTLVIADMHADTLLWKRDVDAPSTRGQVDLDRLERGHVALQILSSVTKSPRGLNYDRNDDTSDNITLLAIAQGQPVRTWGSLLERSLWHAEKLRAAEARTDCLRPIRTRSDLSRLLADRQAGKHCGGRATALPTGVMLSIEGLHDLEGKYDNLDRLFAAGFRMASLTHFFDNQLAGSMHGVAKGGLTPFGLKVIRRMEALGMAVDIAHASHATVADVLRLAKRPIVSSHGGVQATCKVNRNLTDAEIVSVARTGGLIGIGYWDAAVCDTSPQGIVRAIAHVRDLVGIDHVGLGSDFDGSVTTRFDTSRLDAITAALVAAGFSEADIAKVMGGNVVRLLGTMLPA